MTIHLLEMLLNLTRCFSTTLTKELDPAVGNFIIHVESFRFTDKDDCDYDI